jgi:hypothetical protein
VEGQLHLGVGVDVEGQVHLGVEVEGQVMVDLLFAKYY